MAFWLGVAAALAMTCFAPVHARADTIYVCWDGGGDYMTIQAGVNAASEGDEVVVCNGTYTGAGNRDVTITNKDITVKSANGPSSCTIDCEGGSAPNNHRAFVIVTEAGEETCLEGFKIINGYKQGNGGAILNVCGGDDDGSFRIINCVFEDNQAVLNGYLGHGGAIYNQNVPGGAIINCTFKNNKAVKGGAVDSINEYETTNHFDIVNCEFIGNRASTWAGALGGDQSHEATVTNCRFAGNLADDGGGAASCGYYGDLEHFQLIRGA